MSHGAMSVLGSAIALSWHYHGITVARSMAPYNWHVPFHGDAMGQYHGNAMVFCMTWHDIACLQTPWHCHGAPWQCVGAHEAPWQCNATARHDMATHGE